MLTVGERVEVIKALYLSNTTPWLLGYSGGKDSTAVLQLVWQALSQLAPEQLHKAVHVISTDTLVENPSVAQWVARSLEGMRGTAENQGLPIKLHRLTPALKDRFWVNLIGRGYPAPRAKFRWCTSRLKISPVNDFMRDMLQQYGEVIVVLGTRKADTPSAARALRRDQGSHEWLNRNGSLDRSWVYTPIADWTSQNVWLYLTEEKNPWGCDNRVLLAIYRETTAEGADAVTTDSSTPRCGSNQFGCYVCTMKPQESSLDVTIHHNSEKAWMLPLLDFRKRFISECGPGDQGNREPRRANAYAIGTATAHDDAGEGDVSEGAASKRSDMVYGSYKRAFREHLLRELLQTQRLMHAMVPDDLKFDLLGLDELAEIRRIWMYDKYEIEDSVPRIYEEVMGVPYVADKL